MMKIISFFACVLLPSVLYCQSNQFKITGNIVGLESAILYLYKVNVFYGIGNMNELVDSARAIKGSFKIEGKRHLPGLYVLEYSIKNRRSPLFILENGSTHINGNLNDIRKIAIKSGRQQNAYLAYRKLVNSNDNIEISKLVDSIIKYDRSDLKKSQYYENKHTILEDRSTSAYLVFVKAHPYAYASLLVLNSLLRGGVNKVILLEHYNNLNAAIKESVDGKFIYEKLNGVDTKFLKSHIPIFKSKNLNGDSVEISPDHRFLLIEFSASWCKPCMEHLPELIKLYNIKSEKLKIISISLDRKVNDWKTVVAKNQIKWDNICDGQGGANKVAKYFRVNSIPRQILISPKGVVVFDSYESNSEVKIENFLQ
ncbi:MULTISPECIES: thioredoxin-like domain-containing protein [unclassified Sphingobacterium]|uniref:thioredoxin-like domain-containing protein n=1 Tax=unclassified Sphingobacterium TaxID=2609468 RepID=UPI0010465C56|nr:MULTISPECIES: thioredoxin-like domain-containing protein [unclassified Sphingobacterium]MCS3556572.1 thiol-disulfide isomerase/thioredoxin [Sphingobacterium sp. JUb21]TCQ99867.1 thiol-disulfide isomerase/thioredoxin [Sphingobacterium sp. JUb20]